MQSNDMAAKSRLLFDGEEIPGLVRVAEIPLERGEIEVPEVGKIRRIENGIETIPAIEVTYKTARGTNTRGFFRTWWQQQDQKDVTLIRVDSTGTEFERLTLSDCQLRSLVDPETDHANPTYAQIRATIVPWDVAVVDAGTGSAEVQPAAGS